jgi:hypothetical protein
VEFTEGGRKEKAADVAGAAYMNVVEIALHGDTAPAV